VQEYLKAAIKAAKEAGKIALQRSSDIKIFPKGTSGDIVTNVDMEVEQVIVERLSSEFPNFGFICEEKCNIAPNSGLVWVVDPIDGTRNYSIGLPFFCISIALVRKNVPVVGVVYDPNKDEVFYAIQGKGSYLNGKCICVSKKSSLEDAVASISFQLWEKIREFSNKKGFAACRCFGAVALELCYVASARLDLMLRNNINPWDGAAGAVIVREASGVVKNQFGKQWLINDRYLFASNAKLQKEFASKFPQEQLQF